MIRLIGTVAALALAASGPVVAGDKGNSKGQDKGHKGAEHGQMKHGSDHERGNGRQKMQKAVSDQRGQWREDGAKAARVERSDDRRAWRKDHDNDRDGGSARRDREDRRYDDRRDARLDDRWGDGDRRFAAEGWCPPGLARKNNGCLPPGLAKKRDEQLGFDYRPSLFGIPIRTSAKYVYYDGYLVPAEGQRAAYIPLLGGALAVGQLWPEGYPSERLADWQDRYYGLEDQRQYRYIDNVVYRIDPETAAIQSVVALLTGSDFTVGAPLPTGYDVYNVPAPYRDRYFDSEEALYRYADGRIYQVNPTTMLVAKAIEMVL